MGESRRTADPTRLVEGWVEEPGLTDYQAFANEWSGEPQASEQLLQLTDRAIFAASDPKIPSEHLL